MGPLSGMSTASPPGLILSGRLIETGAPMVDAARAFERAGEPEDCAKVVEFLATDLSDYVTGAVIPVDGGWNRGSA